MKTPLAFMLLLTLLGCRAKDSLQENLIVQENFIGTWRLVQYCKPTGQKTCEQVRVPADKGVFIAFSTKNEFREIYEDTKPIEYGFLGCGPGTYQVEDGKLRIRAACMSSLNGQLFDVVSVTQRRLILNPFGSGEYVFEKQ